MNPYKNPETPHEEPSLQIREESPSYSLPQRGGLSSPQAPQKAPLKKMASTPPILPPVNMGRKQGRHGSLYSIIISGVLHILVAILLSFYTLTELREVNVNFAKDAFHILNLGPKVQPMEAKPEESTPPTPTSQETRHQIKQMPKIKLPKNIQLEKKAELPTPVTQPREILKKEIELDAEKLKVKVKLEDKREFQRLNKPVEKRQIVLPNLMTPQVAEESFQVAYDKIERKTAAASKDVVYADRDLLVRGDETPRPMETERRVDNIEQTHERQQENAREVTYETQNTPTIDTSPVVQQRLTFATEATSQRVITGTQFNDAEIQIIINLPKGNVTNSQLFELTGKISPDVRSAFLSINDVTQILEMKGNGFSADITLTKGVNTLNIMVITKKNTFGSRSCKLFFSPYQEGPVITLTSPENGRQGIKAGEEIWVEGRINDKMIQEATLFMNKVPIKINVINGQFKRKVFLSDDKIITFRVMAINRNGVPGYSAQTTVLSGYEVDIRNPRPY